MFDTSGKGSIFIVFPNSCIFVAMLHVISVPECKSIVIRKQFVHFVQTGRPLPLCRSVHCSDVETVVAALSALQQAKTLARPEAVIDVQDCGAAYRFMLPLLSATPGRWLLTGTERLLQRPIEELLVVLRNVGASVERVPPGWRIEGKRLEAASLSVDCSRSSQFASALLLSAPLLGLKELHVSAVATSLPYITMTQACLPCPVTIPEYPYEHTPIGRPGDWSAAVFWYAMALLYPQESFLLKNLSLDSVQGDAVAAKWFAKMGVKSVETEDGVRIGGTTPRPGFSLDFDLSATPDLFPVLAALATLLPAEFRFSHTRNLQYKESDRTANIRKQLSPFSEQMANEEDSFSIKGKPQAIFPPLPWIFHTCQDHRLAMAFLLFGPDARLDDVSCLRKSYPLLMKSLDAFRNSVKGLLHDG